MKFVLVTKDPAVCQATEGAFQPDDHLAVHAEWQAALEDCRGADLMFMDFLATLDEPHKVSGYERFAQAKMAHETAASVPLVLIAPPDDYELDFMVGWPGFVFAQLRRPLTYKLFRRATTWI